MTTDMEKAYGEQLDVAVARGIDLLNMASSTWMEKVNTDIMFMEAVNLCLLTQVFGGYKAGLDSLGIDRGEGYGFDIPNNIYDIDAQFEAYEMLASRWVGVISSRTQV